MPFIFVITYFNLAVLIRHINKCKNSAQLIQGIALEKTLAQFVICQLKVPIGPISVHNEILWETTHL